MPAESHDIIRIERRDIDCPASEADDARPPRQLDLALDLSRAVDDVESRLRMVGARNTTEEQFSVGRRYQHPRPRPLAPGRHYRWPVERTFVLGHLVVAEIQLSEESATFSPIK